MPLLLLLLLLLFLVVENVCLADLGPVEEDLSTCITMINDLLMIMIINDIFIWLFGNNGQNKKELDRNG